MYSSKEIDLRLDGLQKCINHCWLGYRIIIKTHNMISKHGRILILSATFELKNNLLLTVHGKLQ